MELIIKKCPFCGLDISGHGHAHIQTVKKYLYSGGAHIHIVVHWSEEKSILCIGT